MPKVSIIYAHQGDDRFLYDAAVQAGAKGIVVATTGGYALSAQAQAGIQNALNSGIPVIRSSRLATGIVSRTEMDNQQSYIVSGSLNPPKARILLMLALILADDKTEFQNYFTGTNFSVMPSVNYTFIDTEGK